LRYQSSLAYANLLRCVIPRLDEKAGSTSWLYVSWTSQLDVCSMLAGCLLDVRLMSARSLPCFMHGSYLFDVCSIA